MIKKLIFMSLAAVAFLATSCDKYNDEFGSVGIGSEMCGEWIMLDQDGSEFTLLSSNTNKNDRDKMFLTDGGSYWQFAIDVPCSPQAMTFQTPADGVTSKYYSVDDDNNISYYDIKVKVWKGKITKNAVKLPSGTMADMIELEIGFEDYPYGEVENNPDAFTPIVVKGYRKTGFVEDEEFVYDAWLDAAE